MRSIQSIQSILSIQSIQSIQPFQSIQSMLSIPSQARLAVMVVGAVVSFAAATASFSSAAAAVQTHLSPELHLQRHIIGSPVLSPQGDHVAYTVTRTSPETDKKLTSLWLLDLGGGESRQLTRQSNVSDISWANAGDALYFKRGGQLWRLPLTGGEPEVITSIPGGIDTYRINPDSQAPKRSLMMFSKQVSPECPPGDWDCLQEQIDLWRDRPGLVTEALPLRHWRSWQDNLSGAVFIGDPDSDSWQSVTDISGPREPLALAQGDEFAFSPAGDRIVLIRNPDLGMQAALSTNNNIYLIDLADRTAAGDSVALWTSARLLSEGLSGSSGSGSSGAGAGRSSGVGEGSSGGAGGGNDDNPTFSPDGRWLAYTSMKRAGCESDLRLIVLHDLATHEERCLTCGLDRSASGLTWSLDSRYIYFSAYDREATALYRVEITTLTIERLLRCGSLGGLAALPEGRLLLVLGSSRMPNELFICKPDELAREPELWQADLALSADGRFGAPASASPKAQASAQATAPANAPSGEAPASTSAQTRPSSTALRQLTFFNWEWLQGLAMNAPEHFWFIGAREDTVHGFIIRPPAAPTAATAATAAAAPAATATASAPAAAPATTAAAAASEQKSVPLVMVFHGGPQWAYHDFWLRSYNFQMIAALGYAVAVINFHGSTGFGYDFQDGIRAHWGDVPEEDVLRGLDYIVSHFDFVDSTRIAGIGRSYGGYLANWLNGRCDRFSCFVSHSGSYNKVAAWGTTEELWFPEWEFHGTPWTQTEIYQANSPSTYAGRMRTPALIIHGQRDYRVDLSESLQMYTTLKRQGVDARWLTFEDEGHHIHTPEAWRLMWKEIFGWLAQYLN